MSDDFSDLDREMADDPEWQAMTPDQRRRLVQIMERMIELGMAAVYGDEEEDVPDAEMDCARFIPWCKARCCTLIFALTREEVAKGEILHNPRRPYFIARDEDGYCPHMDRQSHACTIWEKRPLRCRRYQCRGDSAIWPDGLPEPLRD
ncbi:MAG TPA: YkgJ family cysteine cluster protein [Thiotrichales bacterium]|nr:YkgJ family cysteine cluster protein [Thiotrichales bacterium]